MCENCERMREALNTAQYITNRVVMELREELLPVATTEIMRGMLRIMANRIEREAAALSSPEKEQPNA